MLLFFALKKGVTEATKVYVQVNIIRSHIFKVILPILKIGPVGIYYPVQGVKMSVPCFYKDLLCDKVLVYT